MPPDNSLINVENQSGGEVLTKPFPRSVCWRSTHAYIQYFSQPYKVLCPRKFQSRVLVQWNDNIYVIHSRESFVRIMIPLMSGCLIWEIHLLEPVPD